jgi:hypothetical protein
MSSESHRGTSTRKGFLLLADISGFTSFLAKSELDHALGILSDLMEVTTKSLQPLFTLSKLEGDAVFAFTPESRVERGETLLELVESTYVNFRRRLDAVHRRTTCECNACRNIPTLDLKFMTHFGEYGLQSVAGSSELIGNDVNVVHRLLKNSISERVGWRGYALFTKQALERMGLTADGYIEGVESYEHIGSVATYTTHLTERFEELVSARPLVVTPQTAHVTLSVDLDAPPIVVWDWLNDPRKREQWQGGEIRPMVRPGGRTKQGAQNHCVHGKTVVIEDVLDWRPFEYLTVDAAMPFGVIQTTYSLEPNGTGTRLVDRSLLRPSLGILKPVSRPFLKLLYRMIHADEQYKKLKQVMNEARTDTP